MSQKQSLRPISLNDPQAYEWVKPYRVPVTNLKEEEDVDALFKVVSDIMGPSFEAADPSLKIDQQDRYKDIPANFDPHTYELKHLACQMMETPHDENHLSAHETTMAIFERVKSSLYAKAVIALAAFALEYGNFWHLINVRTDDNLGRSLAALNHVYALDKRGKDIYDYNHLVKCIFDTVGDLVKLKSYFNLVVDDMEIPFLETAKHDFPIYVYWVIHGLVVCASHIGILLGHPESKTEIIYVSSQITNNYKVLGELMRVIKNWKDEIVLEQEIGNILDSPTDIVQVLKSLLFPLVKTSPIVSHGLSGSPESIENFRQKHVVLFISGLEKIEDEIRLLTSINNDLRKDPKVVKGFRKEDFKFLWIPIVETTDTVDVRNKFEQLKRQMDWYVMEYSRIHPVSVRVIRKRLNFNIQYKQPIAPVYNPQGRRVNVNAMHMMFAWGIDAFPWRPEDDAALAEKWNWFWTEMKKANPIIQNWINEDSYIFLCGASDLDYNEEFLNKFTVEVEKIKMHETTREADAVINCYHYGKNDPWTTARFWHNVESMFADMKGKKSKDPMPTFEEVKSFLCLRHHRSGWVVLSKGSNIKLLYRCDVSLRNCQEFNKWKHTLLIEPGFDVAFEKGLEQLPLPFDRQGPCNHLNLKSFLSDIYSPVYCPSCGRAMEIESVTYKCCHGYKEEVPQDASVDVKIDRRVA